MPPLSESRMFIVNAVLAPAPSHSSDRRRASLHETNRNVWGFISIIFRLIFIVFTHFLLPLSLGLGFPVNKTFIFTWKGTDPPLGGVQSVSSLLIILQRWLLWRLGTVDSQGPPTLGLNTGWPPGGNQRDWLTVPFQSVADSSQPSGARLPTSAG